MIRMRPCMATALATLFLVLLAAASPLAAGTLETDVTCTGANSVEIRWSYAQTPGYPTDPVDWVGYDIYRRSVADCGPFIRVNAEPYPHLPGTDDRNAHSDALPLEAVSYRYRVILVDANRQEVAHPGCKFCSYEDETSCAEQAAPLTQGTLVDWGWALYLTPCPGSCYKAYFFSYGAAIEQLRAYADTDTVVRLFGNGYCGTVEGCEMHVDAYDLAPCDVVTPALPTSWGAIKTLYR